MFQFLLKNKLQFYMLVLEVSLISFKLLK